MTLLLWLLLWLLGMPGPAQAEEKSLMLTFGVYQSDKATVMYRKFTPVLEQLQTRMEQSINRPVDIALRIFRGYKEANDALVAGEVDFVRFGPASYVLAKTRNEAISLIVVELRKGKSHFNGVIIVPTDSPAKRLADLKGKRFAFGNRNSTIGRYLAQGALVRAGVHGADLAAYDYLDRHDKVFKVISLGLYDAGAVKETTLTRYNNKKRVRILHSFKNVTKPWLARAGLDPAVTAAIREALLALKDPRR